MRDRILKPHFASALLLATVVLAGGCSNQRPTGTLSGSVTYNGKPLNIGTVNFLSKSGSAAQAALDENGNFKVDTPIDATEYQVYLAAPVPGQFAPGTKPPPPTARFNVAPKHLDPQTSKVTVTTKSGANEGMVLEFKD